MKFMSSFQCLMGGNAVQFQAASSSVSPTTGVPQSRLPDTNDDDKTRNYNISSSSSNKKKKKKKKMMKKNKNNKNKDTKVIKVFKADGEINLYRKPIRVSEVMTDECMVCRSDSFYIGQKIPPLSQHERLQPGHTYFLLPTHLFHSVLSFVTIASFTSSSSSSSKQIDHDHSTNDDTNKMKALFLKKAAASSCSPFDIQKTSSGTLRIRVSELFISQLMMDSHHHDKKLMDVEPDQAADLLCTTPQLHTEYKQLVVGSRRGWKPKLEMIKETPSKGNKRKVKMLFSASISRMKKKIKNNKNNSTTHDDDDDDDDQLSHYSHQQLIKKKNKRTKKILQPLPVYASIKENKFSRTK